MVKEKSAPLKETRETLEENKDLVLYNDEVNTFDFVINTLIDVCEHSEEQAEQCALIAHFKGKCSVKSGTYDELKPLHTEMTNRKLTVSID
jgi:ATP-dependent Clp protease adaptor protein ClpS